MVESMEVVNITMINVIHKHTRDKGPFTLQRTSHYMLGKVTE